MILYGSMKETFKQEELREVTVSATATELRALAKFLEYAADCKEGSISDPPPHIHFSDWYEEANGLSADVIADISL